MKLSKTLTTLVSKLIYERHQAEAKAEANALRESCKKLLKRGIPEASIINALDHDHGESRVAKIERELWHCQSEDE